MSNDRDTGRPYHLACTGEALATVQAHISPEHITLFGSCFCPFVQRVWVTLEHLGIDYAFRQYYEVDPYKKPAELLELSPKGLVPALRLNNFDSPRALNESTIIIDFLEELATSDTRRSSHTTESLFPAPSDPYARALIRLQADSVNRSLIPAFYRYLQAQDEAKQVEGAKGFVEALESLVTLFRRAEREGYTQYGLWHECGSLSYADVMAAPWLFRATNVLKHYRGFVLPEGEQFRAYVGRMLGHPAVKRTCSTEQLYLDSYERYAFNRPNTSQVANAINAGTALP
ncbi:glutathione S-transferase C-terminal-like protein [Trametes versicolor FP-101664 SS1]|uniref:glutathione S-transferase C-terminal-like protein n=1 Tax=Trametes versicolor (strain FP-101664) TaxID=717944 RepID=UPI000462218A|nr:glutathione S-transferase C-terminal-like protein [Trametes versicolor FP-101664 SS1]EIW56026.1 glutathione S-transferase C-terminal-like protein [Trametes versicolor FP-101664 SS1]